VLPPPPTPKAPPKPPVIGLALGGGAARGFAHIGVIQVLEEAGIRPDLVIGTSAGSLVAALYASGKSGAELAVLARSMDEGAITDWSFPGRGLIRGDALARYVREHTGGKRIEQMKMPLGIVATDLDNGQGIVFRIGDPGVAVRASSAVPAVFQPVRIGAREYVDGGLVAPVPVRMLLQTFSIMGRSINRFELAEADVVLRPKLTGVSGTDFGTRTRSIQAGRDAAAAALGELRLRILDESR
jgi:NTE family protein